MQPLLAPFLSGFRSLPLQEWPRVEGNPSSEALIRSISDDHSLLSFRETRIRRLVGRIVGGSFHKTPDPPIEVLQRGLK